MKLYVKISSQFGHQFFSFFHIKIVSEVKYSKYENLQKIVLGSLCVSDVCNRSPIYPLFVHCTLGYIPSITISTWGPTYGVGFQSNQMQLDTNILHEAYPP